jgi:phosphonatase-like hydrolase
MIQLVVFDMAGTTVDEQNVVYRTVHRALDRAGFPISLETVLQHAAGKEKFQAICDVMEHLDGGLDLLTAKAVHRDFEALLDEAYAALMPMPMPGAERVMVALRERGVKVALNTGYRRSVAEGLLHKLGWAQGTDFDLLITADEVRHSRPHPDMILTAMEHFDIKMGQNVAKIGDSVADIEEGINAGCGITAGITTGAQTREQLQSASPTHIFDSLDELLTAL